MKMAEYVISWGLFGSPAPGWALGDQARQRMKNPAIAVITG
jgi:hypothetical protein